MTQVFVTHPRDKLDHYFGDKAIRALQAIATVRFNDEPRELPGADLAAAAAHADVIISYRGMAAPAELFDALPRLRAFVRCAVDIRAVDVEAASRLGILVTHTGAGFVDAVAEWVIAMMLALSRQLAGYAETYHQGRVPIPAMGSQLRGATIGVIGYGQIGRAVCALARAFGMRVLVSDPLHRPQDEGITHSTLETLLAESDHVVCLAAALAQTENMMDRQAFARMKRGAFFINAARGNLVDDAALLAALDSGALAGCALDVGRAADQMPTLQLAAHPKVLASPHCAGLTRPATEYQALETVAQVMSILDGRVPAGAVNAQWATRCSFGTGNPHIHKQGDNHERYSS
jgi:D-3-phosphoglycerate dehydrogenase